MSHKKGTPTAVLEVQVFTVMEIFKRAQSIQGSVLLRGMQPEPLFFLQLFHLSSCSLPWDEPRAACTEKCNTWAQDTVYLSSSSWQSLWLIEQEGADTTGCLINVKCNLLGSYLSTLHSLFQAGKFLLSFNNHISEAAGRQKYLPRETDAWGLMLSKCEHGFLHFTPLLYRCVAPAVE